MSSSILTRFRRTLLVGALLLSGLPGLALAAYTSANFSSLPLTADQNAANSKPLIMLVMGKDNSLYKKAYTDLTDLTGDGIPNTTYTDSVTYYGYFNSNDCYSYDPANMYYTPAILASGTNNHTCSPTGKYWSGNFLNWASMTRLDVLRKVLYGGYRSTDTAGKTILERAYIPTDGRSFAKVYGNGTATLVPAINQLTPFTPATNYITICNTTPADSGYSQNITLPPLMRVADGNFPTWASNDFWQCTWDGEKTTNSTYTYVQDVYKGNVVPHSSGLVDKSGQGPDYIARTEVCDGNAANNNQDLNASNCTKYTDSSGNSDYKPTGLLQTYGASGKVNFGLITGSYVKSRSGGLLRKNISSFSDEINASDGTFKYDSNGKIISPIVGTINALRMYGYDNVTGTYNTGDTCSWGLSDPSQFPEPDCSNWGNPMSEMYLEAVRYFDANVQSPDTDFTSSNLDSNWIKGVNNVPALGTASWKQTLNANNWCAKCAIIVLNTGPFSYDSDQIDNGFSDLKAAHSAEYYTDEIGNWEKITGNKYFIGDAGGTQASSTGLCTSKTITSLSLALGPCPDKPRLGGSFEIAGIAYWAHTNSLNPNAPSDSPQTITTYAVSLSPSNPSINIPVPGSKTQSVKLLPACRDNWTPSMLNKQDAGDCRITHMRIIQPYTLSGGTATGKIYVNWDDSEQGGDYDKDFYGTISYTIDSSNITITTDILSSAVSSFQIGFGYSISGTVHDGFHVTSGINGFSYPDDTSISNTCNKCQFGDGPTSATYTLSTTSSADILKDPLWYAAKYGGFLDTYGDKTIHTNNSSQWDSIINSTNASGSDKIPDNYFTSSNPGQLATQLNQVLATITAQVSSGTSAAVVANSGSGAGMIVQAYYQPKVTNSSTNPPQDVSWVGDIYSLFVDSNNRLREDNSKPKGQLDSGDDVVSIKYIGGKTQIETYNPTTSSPSKATTSDFNTLQPIWSARDQLANIASSAITTQRSYTTAIGSNTNASGQYTNGRYIFTAIPGSTSNIINQSNVVPFTTTGIDSSNFDWLDLQSDFNGDGKVDVNDADDLVNYIRGKEGIDNFRSRTIDYNGKQIVWRLGDIIHSTPLIVGPPDANYANRYGDTSYQAYKEQYKHRRVMVYAGANDGMLHAFNAGFFDPKYQAYCTQPPDTDKETTACSSFVSGNYMDDPLGSELWAYVPSNLLPQLQWLPEKNYPHVYYVDGSPKSFDVDIFPPDSVHPDGWGTILVVGMRLGGGEMDYTLPDGTAVKAHSAYMIFDITDPEHKPVLLGEINAKNLGFTTSTPNIMVRRVPGSGNDWTNTYPNDWYLVFGSGPTDLNTVTSTQNARLYVLNLNDLTDSTTPSVQYATGYDPYVLGAANSFVGDVSSIDWTNNYKTDAAYFGIAGGTPTSPTGQLMRLVLSGDTGTSWSPSTVIDPGQPFINPPQFAVDESNNWWVYDGTGRLYVDKDGTSTKTQSYYGIKEPVSNGALAGTAVTTSDLQQTTGVLVGTDSNNTLYQTVSGVLPNNVKTFNDLQTDIASKSGWYINFPTDNTKPSTGSPRNLGASTLFSQLMLFTTFAPNNNSCTFNGASRLYAVYYKTGTAYPNAGLDNITCATCGTGAEVTPPSTSLDGSIVTGGVLIGVGANTNFYTTDTKGSGTSTGVKGVPTPTGRQSWREIIPQ